MIPKSFSNEIEKIAFLATLGKFFAKNVPSMLESLRGAEMLKGVVGAQAAGISKAKMVGGLLGTVGGAYAGSDVGNTPEAKHRNTIAGGIIGGVAGAIGLGKIVPKVQAAATSTAKDVATLGKFMQQPGANISKTVDFAAKKFGPQFASAGKNAPTTKTFFGLGKETKAIGMQTAKPSAIGGAIGELAESMKTIKDAPNFASGVGKVLKQNWEQAKSFTKDVGGKTYKFQRSGIGKVVNPALTSGLGFGALEAATMKNEDGSKPTMSKRLLHGGTTALTWGAAPKLMFGKTLAYDIPKTLIGMKKQKEIPTQ